MARSRIIAGKAVIIIEAQDLINKTLGKIRGNLHRFSNEVGKIGEGLFRTGFFGAIGSGVIVSSFVKFDDAMRTLRVNLDLFGKSAQEVDSVLKPLEERIRSLAKTTPFSPTQVAGAATELAKGGFNPKQIIDSLQAVLDLSRATNTELSQSSEFVVRTMTTYGIATENAAEVVSQLVRAARKGTLGIEDLEAALRYSSGTADNLGISLQKMLAIFATLSNKGLVGSLAGTSTNAAISNLVKKAQELKDIGAIDIVTGIREDGREALDLIKTLENLFRYAETLPFIKQQTLFQDVFNLRGARSVSAIRKELEQIKGLTGFISDAGDEAARAAAIMDEGIGGSLRRLFSTLQELGITLGQTVEQPITRIASVIKGLLDELGKVAALNPELTSLVILSPGILLAAGAGMFVLAKGLRLAAYSAGALKGALGPIGRLLSKGTVGQLTALSQLRKLGDKAPNPRKAAADAIRIQKTNLATLRARTPVSSVVAAKQAKQITTAQRALTRARNKAGKLPKSARTPFFGLKAGLSAAKGFSFARITKSLVTFGSVFKTVFTGIRRLFSTTGLLTVLEVLILFGDKIPIVKNALAGLGKGFSNAFKQIGDIAKYARGPLELFKASIDAFMADRSDLGVQGLLFAFSSLASIIGNQLSAAWNKFKETIAPVYDFIVGLFDVIDVTIQSIVESISQSIGSTLSTFSKVTNLVSGQGLGDLGNGFLSGVRYVAEEIAKLIPSLFNWIAQFTISLNEASQKFLIGLEYTLNSLNPTTSQKSADDTRTAQLGTVANESRLSRKNLADDLKNTLERITQTFNTSSASTSRANANKAIEDSKLEREKSLANAEYVRQQLALKQIEQQKEQGNFDQGITPGNIQEIPAVKAMLQIVDALVGSAQSTSRNLLRAGKPLEQKQLEEQEKTNEILEKMARERGIQFAP